MSLQITLEPQEVNVVLSALGELPLKSSLDLWFKIKSQAEQQFAAQQPAPAASDTGGDTGEQA